MDWFTTSLRQGLDAAQKKAQELQQQAKLLSEQATQQAKLLAEQATVQAKVLAEKAVEEASLVQSRIKSHAAATSSGPGADQEVSRDELIKFGVTEGLLECIQGLTYSMFSDMKSEMFPALPTANVHPLATGSLTPWQERHALLVLGQAPHLQGLRFALSPRHMTDYQFWSIYFKLVDSILPTESQRDKAMQEFAATNAARSSTLPATPADVAATAAEAAKVTAARAADVFGSLLRSTQGLLSTATADSTAATATTTTTSGSTKPTHSSSSAALASMVTIQGGGAAVDGSSYNAAALGDATASRSISRTQSASQKLPTASSGKGSSSLLPPQDEEAADRQGLTSPGGTPGDKTGVTGMDSPALSDAMSEPLGDLEDDPELAAYLEEALAVDDVDLAASPGGDDFSGLGSDLDDGDDEEDMDDYINKLDAELAADAVTK